MTYGDEVRDSRFDLFHVPLGELHKWPRGDRWKVHMGRDGTDRASTEMMDSRIDDVRPGPGTAGIAAVLDGRCKVPCLLQDLAGPVPRFLPSLNGGVGEFLPFRPALLLEVLLDRVCHDPGDDPHHRRRIGAALYKPFHGRYGRLVVDLQNYRFSHLSPFAVN